MPWNPGTAEFLSPATSTAGEFNLKTVLALGDVAVVLSAAEMDGGIVTHAPAVARVLTTDTAAAIIAQLSGSVDGTHFELTVVNTGASTSTLAGGAGVTIVGAALVSSLTSGTFRVRRAASSTVVAYRI